MARSKTSENEVPSESQPESTVDFERSMSELESLVEQMEQAELPLEDALKRFERGIALARVCETALKQAEQRVEQLLEKNGELQTVPFPEQE